MQLLCAHSPKTSGSSELHPYMHVSCHRWYNRNQSSANSGMELQRFNKESVTAVGKCNSRIYPKHLTQFSNICMWTCEHNICCNKQQCKQTLKLLLLTKQDQVPSFFLFNYMYIQNCDVTIQFICFFKRNSACWEATGAFYHHSINAFTADSY